MNLFKLFINDLILFIKQANLHNYAGDNTIIYFSKLKSAAAINWLKQQHVSKSLKFSSIISVEKKGTY